MTHRAKMLGGQLKVGPDEFGGTEVLCIVPLAESTTKPTAP